MMNVRLSALLVVMFVLTGPVVASETGTPAASAAGGPIVLHMIEGVSGGLITPVAYFGNPGADGAYYGMPSFALTFFNLGSKNIYAFTYTQTFFDNWVELGYAYNYVDLGSLENEMSKFGNVMGQNHTELHNLNLRFKLLKENSYRMKLPEVALGFHFKYNDGIEAIDNHLLGGLAGLGYRSRSGMDFTLTVSKTFADLAWGRPVILTAGVRNSKAAVNGYFGFGSDRKFTFEGSVLYMPTDSWVLGYEFRDRESPYLQAGVLIEDEDPWHAISATYIVNENWSISGVWGILGAIINADANGMLGVQAKCQF